MYAIRSYYDLTGYTAQAGLNVLPKNLFEGVLIFVAREDTAAAGLTPEFGAAVGARLDGLAKEPCDSQTLR